MLVEAMATGEAELLIAARRDAVVPALVVAVGGVWTEVLADAVVIPLPATPERVMRAIHSLRAAPLLTGGRGRPPLAVEAAATLASAGGRRPAGRGPRAAGAQPGHREPGGCRRGRCPGPAVRECR